MNMQTPIHQRPALRLGAIAVVSLGAALVYFAQTRDSQMSQIFAQPNPEVAQHEAFPSDIEAVERAWGEPIPDHLDRIGWFDEWGWAQIYRETSDPPGIFHGEYRNWRVRYRGQFRYVHRDGGPVPDDVFSRYFMGRIDGTAIIFDEVSDTPPVDYFELVPTDPSRIELSPLAP